MAVTLPTDSTGVKYAGVERGDGGVETYVRQRPEWVAARPYDGTTTGVAAGATVSYDLTNALAGCTEVSVSVVEMTQQYEVSLQTRPVAAASLYNEATVTGSAMASGSIASCRHGFALTGPIGAHVFVVIKNVSASPATLKGVYVSGR